jgi:hypothetical protein
MEIDCGRCQMRGTGCQDCVVTVLEPRNVASFSAEAPGYLGEAPGYLGEAPGYLGEAPGYLGEAPGYLGEAEVKALGVLAAAGMVPPLRLSLPGSTLPGLTQPGSTILPGARAWTQRVFPDTKAS